MGEKTNSNDLVTALTYATPGADESGQALIRVSPNLEIARKNEEYLRRLEGVDTQSLIDLQFKFSDNLPYLKLCSDERIREYFGQWNLPIESRADLELFSQTLAERIVTLARDDSGARRYVKQKEYGAQLAKLPQEISNFSKDLADLKFLEKPLEALVKLAFDSAIDNGFVMNENGEDAIEKYEGTIKILKYNNAVVNVALAAGKYSLEFSIFPTMHKHFEKKGFFSRKKAKYEFSREDLTLMPFVLLDARYNCCSDNSMNINAADLLSKIHNTYYQEYYQGLVFKTNNVGFIEYLKRQVLKDPKKLLQPMIQISKLILHGPRYIQNYAKRTVSEFGEAVQMIKSD